jgi:hypothetical protein
MDAEHAREIAEKWEAYTDAMEFASEVQAAHESEVAFAGDSWPGAELDVERALSHARALEAELRVLDPEAFKPKPLVEEPVTGDDIPF